MIKIYTRDKHNQKTGCLVALKNTNDVVGIGFSKCCKDDKFDKKRATDLAVKRAELIASGKRSCSVPHSMREDYLNMAERARRFYKDKTIKISTSALELGE